MDVAHDNEIIKTVALWTFPALLMIIGAIVKWSFNRQKEIIDSLSDRIHKLELDNVALKKDVEHFSYEDVIILKRDQMTVWKAIDEIKSSMGKSDG
jgi:hypothetical protein